MTVGELYTQLERFLPEMADCEIVTSPDHRENFRIEELAECHFWPLPTRRDPHPGPIDYVRICTKYNPSSPRSFHQPVKKV